MGAADYSSFEWDSMFDPIMLLLGLSPSSYQGYNVRKVISEVYVSFVLQRTVSWR